MKLTVRSFLELAVGLACLVYVVIAQFSGKTIGSPNDLLMAALSLVGVVIVAHAIWLMRK